MFTLSCRQRRLLHSATSRRIVAFIAGCFERRSFQAHSLSIFLIASGGQRMVHLASLLIVSRLSPVPPHPVRAWVRQLHLRQKKSAAGLSLIRSTSRNWFGLQELTRLERAKQTQLIYLTPARFRKTSTDLPIRSFHGRLAVVSIKGYWKSYSRSTCASVSGQLSEK